MTPDDLPAGSTIAVLGAERTGKTELSNALVPRLRARRVSVVDGHALPDCAFTLLMGLDLPVPNTEIQKRREQADALLRTALTAAGRPFAVVHGRGSERLANALRALGLGASNSPGRLVAWDCDKCSDPACEHRLFTDLLRRRTEADTNS